MRIAVTYDNGEIFQHFGHTENFKVYDVEDGKVVSANVLSSEGSGHGALATLLSGNKVDILICGGIGGGAQMALAQEGIKLYGGVSGNADAAVEALLAESLSYNPDVKCDHHGEGHEHHGNCASGGCGGGLLGGKPQHGYHRYLHRAPHDERLGIRISRACGQTREDRGFQAHCQPGLSCQRVCGAGSTAGAIRDHQKRCPAQLLFPDRLFRRRQEDDRRV